MQFLFLNGMHFVPKSSRSGKPVIIALKPFIFLSSKGTLGPLDPRNEVDCKVTKVNSFFLFPQFFVRTLKSNDRTLLNLNIPDLFEFGKDFNVWQTLLKKNSNRKWNMFACINHLLNILNRQRTLLYGQFDIQMTSRLSPFKYSTVTSLLPC